MIQNEKPYIGIVGCSYSNWKEGNCLGKSYPALIAKDYQNYNVIDLTYSGSSNDSAYFRLWTFEQYYNIKFSKVIFQITHIGRLLEFLDWKFSNFNIFEKNEFTGNYFYCNDIKKPLGYANISIATKRKWIVELRERFVKVFGLKKDDTVIRYYILKLGFDEMLWKLQKEINLINGVYGVNNVLLFSWKILKFNDNIKNLQLPSNYWTSVEELFGNDKFYELGVDALPHYGEKGHAEFYKELKIKLKKWL